MLSLWEDQVCHQIKTNDKSEKLRSPLEKVVTLVRCGKGTEQQTYNWAPRNSFDLTAIQGTATFSASCLSRLPLKGGSPVFIHEDSSQLGMKWGLKERNYRKATALSLLSPSLPEATLLPSCEVEEVGKGHGAGAATASGLSVPPWVQAHVSISNWPLEDRWSRTHLFVYDKRKREIALIELGIIRQSNYRLMKWRKWGNTHLEVGK